MTFMFLAGSAIESDDSPNFIFIIRKGHFIINLQQIYLSISLSIYIYSSFIFRAQEPKAPVTYYDHALSGVRPSSVVR